MRGDNDEGEWDAARGRIVKNILTGLTTSKVPFSPGRLSVFLSYLAQSPFTRLLFFLLCLSLAGTLTQTRLDFDLALSNDLDDCPLRLVC